MRPAAIGIFWWDHNGPVIWPIFRVRVIGPSMEPALANGEVVWARRGGIALGAVAVFREPDRPEMIAVKRIDRLSEQGVWLVGDNLLASHDSRHYGWVPRTEVLGTLLNR